MIRYIYPSFLVFIPSSACTNKNISKTIAQNLLSVLVEEGIGIYFAIIAINFPVSELKLNTELKCN